MADLSQFFKLKAINTILLKKIIILLGTISGCEIAPNTGTNVTKFFTLATESSTVVTKLVTRMLHHDHTQRYSELNRFAKIILWQTSLLSLFPKCGKCILIDNKTPSRIEVSLNVVYQLSQCPLCRTLQNLILEGLSSMLTA